MAGCESGCLVILNDIKTEHLPSQAILKNWEFLILHTLTTREFHSSHTGSTLSSRLQKTIVKNCSSDVNQKIMEHALNILDCIQKVDL